MIRVLFGLFIVLHGLVHMLYFGHSARFYELQAGLKWPDGAWAFTSFLGNETTRMLANVLLVVTTLIFLAGGAGVFFKQEWWRVAITAAAVFSTVTYFLLWNGKFEKMADNGWVGILINAGILAALVLFKWPRL